VLGSSSARTEASPSVSVVPAATIHSGRTSRPASAKRALPAPRVATAYDHAVRGASVEVRQDLHCHLSGRTAAAEIE